MTRHAFGSSVLVRRDGPPRAGGYGAGFVSTPLGRRYDGPQHWWPAEAAMAADFVQDRYMLASEEVAQSALFAETLDLDGQGALFDGAPVGTFANLSWWSPSAMTLVIGVDAPDDGGGGTRGILIESSASRFVQEIGGYLNATVNATNVGGVTTSWGAPTLCAVAFDGTGRTLITSSAQMSDGETWTVAPASLTLGSFPGGSSMLGGHITHITAYQSRKTGSALTALVS